MGRKFCPNPPWKPHPNPQHPPDAIDTVTVGNLLAPDVFRHPQADREIVLHDVVVAYSLTRARRRSIGFMVGVDGLSVSVPRAIGTSDIDSALRAKANWILRKLGEQRERGDRLQQARVEWRDGTTIPFLGEPVLVVIDPHARHGKASTVLSSDAQLLSGSAAVPGLRLHVGLQPPSTAEQLRDAVQIWLKRQARRVFEERCQIFTQRLGVRYTRLSLSSAQTRWGSASADGSIRLNWRLIHLAMPTIDYVVAHELAHLREMNHSPRFWAVVRSVLPDFEVARVGLKDHALPTFD